MRNVFSTSKHPGARLGWILLICLFGLSFPLHAQSAKTIDFGSVSHLGYKEILVSMSELTGYSGDLLSLEPVAPQSKKTSPDFHLLKAEAGKAHSSQLRIVFSPRGDEFGDHSLEKTAHSAQLRSNNGDLLLTLTGSINYNDQDGDGLLDSWELEDGGIDSNSDGILDLRPYCSETGCDPVTGARIDRPDIYVEVDGMAGFNLPGHSVDLLVDSFINSPVTDDATSLRGINLHIDRSELDLPIKDYRCEEAGGIPSEVCAGFGINPSNSFDEYKSTYFGEPEERADPNWEGIKEARALIYHYCLVGRHNSSLSPKVGQAEIFGNDFSITIAEGDGEYHEEIASTFMHMLGHNLGLDHGGADAIDFKPNYASVMNTWLSWPSNLFDLDIYLSYSRSEFNVFDESEISEPEGAGIPQFGSLYAGYRIPFVRNNEIVFVPLFARVALDWNGSGNIDSQAYSSDLRRDLDYTVEVASRPQRSQMLNMRFVESPGEHLRGHNDWENLRYNFRNSPNFPSDQRTTYTTKELDWSLANFIKRFPGGGRVIKGRGSTPPAADEEDKTYFYPNPISEEDNGGVFRFVLEDDLKVNIRIYDSSGIEVATLFEEGLTRGREVALSWNGRNKDGDVLANGTYFYILEARDQSASGTIVVEN